VKGEKILSLGPFQAINSFIDADTEVVDLEDRTLLPEYHHHTVLSAYNRFLFTNVHAIDNDFRIVLPKK